MKKRMMNLVLALMAMLPLQAQSLDGKWMALDEEDGTAMAYILVFEGDLMRQALVSSTDAENVGQVTVAIAVPAQSFTPGAKKLNFTFDAKQFTSRHARDILRVTAGHGSCHFRMRKHIPKIIGPHPVDIDGIIKHGSKIVPGIRKINITICVHPHSSSPVL